MSSRIFVKGLPPTITEAEMRKHFSSGGRDVTDVKIIPQRRIGYVGFKTSDDASKAVKHFNRTYVRMSRISVEPAKAISDPSLDKQHGRRGARPVGSPAKRKEPEETRDETQVSNKRKRTDGERPATSVTDPKLREFLQVMGKSREDALADAVAAGGENPAAADEDAAAAVAMAEGESDDEYEQIPSKAQLPKKSSADPPPRTTRAVPGTPAQGGDGKGGDGAQMTMGGETLAEDHETHEPITADETDAPPATDDDWLRSRTNRLLDLMDPEDMAREPPSQVAGRGSAQPPGTGGPPDTKMSPEDKDDEADDDAPEDVGGNHHGNDKINNKEVAPPQPTELNPVEAIRQTSRLFVRNLPYGASEDDIRECFEQFGSIEEVHIPLSKTGSSKGFALVLFDDSSRAVEAFQSMDGTTFQGRILHIIPGSAKRDSGLDEYEISKLPLKKQNLIRKRAEAASNTFNWNSLFMNQDAVNASVASRLGVSKSELLDPTSADAAVKQAIAETTVIQETKAYFAANGVDLDAFRSSRRRGDTAILVKNFPHGTTAGELRTLFEESGPVLQVLMPPSGTIAIVNMAQANHAQAAFARLAYRRIRDSVLFLEKAPKGLLPRSEVQAAATSSLAGDRPTGVQKLNVDELLSSGDKADEASSAETASLFVRNLNFDTSTDGLAAAFEPLDGFLSARVKTKADPKRPGKTLSMGFGFVEFRSREQAALAQRTMDGYVLDGHALGIKASHRGLDAAEEKRREEKARRAAGQRTKIIVKNLPFQATKRDIRALFGTYGQLRSVRVPVKADHTARGFAFADFVSPREAQQALASLRDTHLLGRKLVLDFAEAEAADAEEEIEKMQRKVGGQADKMALQRLTGKGRQRVNIGDEDEDNMEG